MKEKNREMRDFLQGDETFWKAPMGRETLVHSHQKEHTAVEEGNRLPLVEKGGDNPVNSRNVPRSARPGDETQGRRCGAAGRLCS